MRSVSTLYTPLFKWPPEPTRVKSPEQLLMRSGSTLCTPLFKRPPELTRVKTQERLLNAHEVSYYILLVNFLALQIEIIQEPTRVHGSSYCSLRVSDPLRSLYYAAGPRTRSTGQCLWTPPRPSQSPRASATTVRSMDWKSRRIFLLFIRGEIR